MEFAGKGSSECTSEGPAALSARKIIYTAHRLQESRGKHQISSSFHAPSKCAGAKAKYKTDNHL